MSKFLEASDLAILTGRKVKSKQIEVLRKMGIAFFVNACGKPVVAIAAVEGPKRSASVPIWTPPR
ncbi:DUF4224 domain-containing protein [Herbaspirillum sp. NPDC101397]|uniref:DUF4224 domain-containing protein n=1 Tax=Herbaspirillum sp. NPDC101397 TaxID=3364006 RepID=UPI003839FD58